MYLHMSCYRIVRLLTLTSQFSKTKKEDQGEEDIHLQSISTPESTAPFFIGS